MVVISGPTPKSFYRTRDKVKPFNKRIKATFTFFPLRSSQFFTNSTIAEHVPPGNKAGIPIFQFSKQDKEMHLLYRGKAGKERREKEEKCPAPSGFEPTTSRSVGQCYNQGTAQLCIILLSLGILVSLGLKLQITQC